jgi:hypothetical protein
VCSFLLKWVYSSVIMIMVVYVNVRLNVEMHRI